MEIVKGDLVEVNGERATAASEIYTRLIFDSYDCSIIAAGGEGGTAVGCINVVYPSGVMRTVRLDRHRVVKLPD
jgi:hypothetical protein